MVWFYTRGVERRSCETRLPLHGDGYELVVRDAADTHVERFAELRRLLGREHELLTAWRAQGWRHAVGPGSVHEPAGRQDARPDVLAEGEQA